MGVFFWALTDFAPRHFRFCLRSRSRSPGGESRSRHHQLPPELLRHLEYGLVDPPPAVAMRGEIPYTNVETTTANARNALQPRSDVRCTLERQTRWESWEETAKILQIESIHETSCVTALADLFVAGQDRGTSRRRVSPEGRHERRQTRRGPDGET